MRARSLATKRSAIGSCSSSVEPALDRGVQVGVVEHDERALAAELERERHAAPGGALADHAPDLGGAGEGDLVEALVPHQCRARAAVAGDHVEHALRQAGLVRQLGERERREGGVLGRLEHDGAARRERGRHLPRQHQQREVPRDDLATDAHARPARELALEQGGPTGVVVEVPRHQRDVEVARLADRLAVVERLQHGQQARVLLDLAGERVEVARAAVATERLPGGQRGAGGAHGAVDVGVAALGAQRERGAGGRVDGLEGVGAGGFEHAVDHMPEAPAVPRQPGAGGVGGLGGGAVVERLEQVANGHDAAHDTTRCSGVVPGVQRAHGAWAVQPLGPGPQVSGQADADGRPRQRAGEFVFDRRAGECVAMLA